MCAGAFYIPFAPSDVSCCSFGKPQQSASRRAWFHLVLMLGFQSPCCHLADGMHDAVSKVEEWSAPELFKPRHL